MSHRCDERFVGTRRLCRTRRVQSVCVGIEELVFKIDVKGCEGILFTEVRMRRRAQVDGFRVMGEHFKNVVSAVGMKNAELTPVGLRRPTMVTGIACQFFVRGKIDVEHEDRLRFK